MANEIDIDLRTGDYVQIKTPLEIAATLDANGMLENLPFMPEMIEFCGKNARVKRRAEKTCIEYPGGGYKIREFQNNNVVVLDGLRCSGESHDGCQRACVFFWKKAWLRKADASTPTIGIDRLQAETLRAKLKTMSSPTHYVCQSTELARATEPMTRAKIFAKCVSEIRSGSRGLFEMTKLIVAPLWRKATRKIPRKQLAGPLKRTPVGNLELQPGEWVTIKPATEIAKTLDNRGRNRGLTCDYGMSNHSGERLRVRHRLDRMISEPTAEMRRVEATVVLEGLNCTCANVVGGCPRQDFIYWREIWLERLEEPKQNEAATANADDERDHQVLSNALGK
jgi:hypothetical protein